MLVRRRPDTADVDAKIKEWDDYVTALDAERHSILTRNHEIWDEFTKARETLTILRDIKENILKRGD